MVKENEFHYSNALLTFAKDDVSDATLFEMDAVVFWVESATSPTHSAARPTERSTGFKGRVCKWGAKQEKKTNTAMYKNSINNENSETSKKGEQKNDYFKEAHHRAEDKVDLLSNKLPLFRGTLHILHSQRHLLLKHKSRFFHFFCS